MLLASAIQGFNREYASVQSIKDRKGTVRGWVFEAQCGTIKKFYPEFFHDCYGAAMRALEMHRHNA